MAWAGCSVARRALAEVRPGGSADTSPELTWGRAVPGASPEGLRGRFCEDVSLARPVCMALAG